jgi:hypothetical protein
MNPTQLPFLVEAVLILVAMAIGVFLDRAGRPFGKVKLGFHIFFALWFTVGFGFILYGISRASVSALVWIPVALMGLAILGQLVTGILMLAGKTARAYVNTHLVSAIVLLLADACAFFLAGKAS